MAKSMEIKNTHSSFRIRCRAICEDDSFRGPWRDNSDAATLDAAEHRSQPGNARHIINIIIEQTSSMRFIG